MIAGEYRIIYTEADLAGIGIRDMADVTPDSPFFAEAQVFDISQENPERYDAVGYASCTVALIGFDGAFLIMDVLRDMTTMRSETICLPVKQYSRLTVPFGSVALGPLPSDEKLRAMYRNMQNARKGGEFTVKARLYEGAGMGLGAAVVPGSDVEWNLHGEMIGASKSRPVADAKGALQWVVENHPDYYMGAIVESSVEGVPGEIVAPPGRARYASGYFENAPERRRFVRDNVIKGKKIKMGPKEYFDKWSELHGMGGGDDDEDDGDEGFL